jgi:hypothetical protein
MLKSFLHALFGQPHSHRVAIVDPLLGELTPCEDGWAASVSRGKDSFQFTIGGDEKPDAALLAHARDILVNFESFKKLVQGCIQAESSEYPEELKREVSGLEIDGISLCWPDRPDDGMIFFRGTGKDFGLWRCDYVARKPQGLGCDT